MNTNSPRFTSFLNYVSLISGLIGIFGFVTGIFSLPTLLATLANNQVPTTGKWFSYFLPWYISLPVCGIAILVVYGLLFFFYFQAYRFLYRLHILPMRKPQHDGGRRYEYAIDKVTTVGFAIFGDFVALLLLPAFIDFEKLSVPLTPDGAPPIGFLFIFILLGLMPLTAFLIQVSRAALEGAILYEERYSLKRVFTSPF